LRRDGLNSSFVMMSECLSCIGSITTSHFVVFLFKAFAIGFAVGLGVYAFILMMIWLDWYFDILPLPKDD